MSDNKDLSVKESLFVERYLVHFNGSRAVREAGYNVSGQAEQAHKLLRKPHIKKLIDEGLKIVCERNEVNQNETVQDLLRMAKTRMKDYVEVVRIEHKDDDGVVYKVTEDLLLKNWDDIDTDMIKEIKQTKDGVHFKLYDRQRARETLSKYHGILIENLKLDANVRIRGFSDLVSDIEDEVNNDIIEANKDLFE